MPVLKMKITINGKTEAVSDGLTIEGLIRERLPERRFCIVELNETIVKARDWPRKRLQEGDSLEVIHVVGGGS